MNIDQIAQLGPPEDIWPFLLGALMFMIPIIAILTHHQRKMAMIMRGHDEEGRPIQGIAQPSEDVRLEMAELRQLVAQQAIQLDNLAGRQEEILKALAAKSEARDLENRLQTK
jgi:hypothetical protein